MEAVGAICDAASLPTIERIDAAVPRIGPLHTSSLHGSPSESSSVWNLVETSKEACGTRLKIQAMQDKALAILEIGPVCESIQSIGWTKLNARPFPLRLAFCQEGQQLQQISWLETSGSDMVGERVERQVVA